MNKTFKDAIVCGGICLVALVAYWDALGLPPPLYDPLGAGRLPKIVTISILVLSAIVVGQSAIKEYLMSGPTRPAKPREFPLRPWLAVAVFGYALLFAISLALRVPYWASSVVFLFITVLTFSRFKRTAILPSAIIALVVGVAVYLLFSSVFRVDLP